MVDLFLYVCLFVHCADPATSELSRPDSRAATVIYGARDRVERGMGLNGA